MAIRDNIKKRRLQLNMTLEDVAKLTGVTRQTIQKYESGVIQSIPSERIKLLAKALKTSPSYLMGWDETAERDDDLLEYLEYLRMRPEMKVFLDLTKNATKQDVEKSVQIIEAFLKK